MQVHKFGGASVCDASAIRNLEVILGQLACDHLVVVVSAMGKVTNQLELVTGSYMSGDGTAMTKLDSLRKVHLDIVEELGLANNAVIDLLNDILVEAEWLLEDEPLDSYDYIYDQIVGIGELLSTRIVHAFLQSRDIPVVFVDIRDVIKTDDQYRDGNIDWDSTYLKVKDTILPLLKDRVVVTQGFIAGTNENNTITLGREGSDYTGAILANCLNATSLTVWKDVPGVLTEDPALSSEGTLLTELSYKEALEMTYYGAKVIHPKTLKPLRDKLIPLYVRSFADLTKTGTRVHNEDSGSYPPIKVVLPNQVLLRISTKDFSFIVEDHLSQIFSELVNQRIGISMMKNLALSFSLVMSDNEDTLPSLIESLQEEFDCFVTRDVTLVTIRHYKDQQLSEIRTSSEVLIEETDVTTAQFAIRSKA